MIRKLLTTAATSATLVVSVMIGLEAVGLLFQGAAPPRTIASVQMQGEAVEDAEAILLRPLEALEHARLRRQAQPEETLATAAPPDGVRPAVDEERYLADALRWAEQYRRRREAQQQRLTALDHPQQVAPEANGETERELPPPQGPPKLIEAVTKPAGEHSSGTHVAKARPPATPAECTAPCRTKPIGWQDNPPARARHRQARAGRAAVHRGSSYGCPFPGWLETVLAPPRSNLTTPGPLATSPIPCLESRFP